MHDDAGRLLDEVNDLGDRRSVGIARDDDGARLDHRGVPGLVEQGPHEAGFVLVVEVCGDVDGGSHTFMRRAYDDGPKPRPARWV